MLFHTASFFGLIYIFCLLMEVIILALPFEHLFKAAGRLCLILCLATMTFPVFSLLLFKRNTYMHLRWTPNLKSVFTSMEDLALIVDYKGVIAEVNHPERLEALLGGECRTIVGLMSRLREKNFEKNPENPEPRLLKTNKIMQFEIHFSEEAKHYLFSLTPIEAGKIHLGATIVIHDITELKASEQQMKLHNEYLMEANQKLSNYVKIANVLEAEKERLSLLKQVQAGLSCKIEAVIAHVRYIQRTSYESMQAYQKETAQVAVMLRNVYKDVRISIQNISGKERG